jgi:DNA invertase Pin-like site-specific DNA recombinase
MTKRVAFYLRVSTGEQTTENQRRELEVVAQHRGWDVVVVYEDKGISGAKGREKRPQFDRMLRDASGASSMCSPRGPWTAWGEACRTSSARSVS